MKGRVFAVLLIVVMATAVGVVIGVIAGGGGPAKNSPMPPNIIVVSGAGTVSTAPDKATVRLGADTSGPTAEDALQANAVRTEAILKALRDAGVEDKDIQTESMSVNKRVENRGTPNEAVSFNARQGLTVVIHDVTQVGTVIDAAVHAGANDVGGIEFGLSDIATAKNAALEEAIGAAEAKARTLAAAADATVGPVVRIDENNYDVVTNFQRYDMDMALAVPSAGTAISPGQVETQVQVRVTFELAPPAG